MKTSVMEVHDMLSVLSVDEVEERIGKVRGVESVTVNYAAKDATVRYDETRLEIRDIKSAVRQSGYEAAAVAGGAGHEDRMVPGAPPAVASKTAAAAPATADAASAMPMSAAPKSAPDTPPASAVPAGDGQKDKGR